MTGLCCRHRRCIGAAVPTHPAPRRSSFPELQCVFSNSWFIPRQFLQLRDALLEVLQLRALDRQLHDGPGRRNTGARRRFFIVGHVRQRLDSRNGFLPQQVEGAFENPGPLLPVAPRKRFVLQSSAKRALGGLAGFCGSCQRGLRKQCSYRGFLAARESGVGCGHFPPFSAKLGFSFRCVFHLTLKNSRRDRARRAKPRRVLSRSADQCPQQTRMLPTNSGHHERESATIVQ